MFNLKIKQMENKWGMPGESTVQSLECSKYNSETKKKTLILSILSSLAIGQNIGD